MKKGSPGILGLALLLLPRCAIAQGTLADYQRAERFLPQNLRKLFQSGDVTPHWIGKTNRFWYRRADGSRSEFILVDPEKAASEPAFDHQQMATALSRALKKEVKGTELPFETFEFPDAGRVIRVRIDQKEWTCTIQPSYECKETPDGRKDIYEELSPDGRFAEYV